MSYFTFEFNDKSLSNYPQHKSYLHPGSNNDAKLVIDKIISSCFDEETIDKIKRFSAIPLSELITPFENARTQKIPRPQNKFVIYRRNLQMQMATELGMVPVRKLESVSKIAGRRWREEASEIKELFGLISECAKKVHNFLYPDYVYRPRRSATTNIPMNSSFHRVSVTCWKSTSSKRTASVNSLKPLSISPNNN
ncbi:18538_t:CDS:1 [Acaulospora morrowiae]|uniref:18538_t:CDS:1 n=1 Tax=Acaulospora morrowiae TaxID=94023 RepID=A0A9N9DDZ2_9GLOM|nr:18538_t:CDS:1 [Acaulospora morrowiae]